MKSFWSLERNVWSQAMLRKRYKLIYADPPWRYGGMNTESLRVRHRRLLSAIDIASLPVHELVDDDAVLAMWWPSNMPMEALQVMKEWGFRLYSMSGLIWIKQGRGHVESELCLLAVRGHGLDYIRDWKTNTVITSQKRRAAQRPVESRSVLESIIGAQPKLELFIDGGSKAWDSWLPATDEVAS